MGWPRHKHTAHNCNWPGRSIDASTELYIVCGVALALAVLTTSATRLKRESFVESRWHSRFSQPAQHASIENRAQWHIQPPRHCWASPWAGGAGGQRVPFVELVASLIPRRLWCAVWDAGRGRVGTATLNI